ncbi:E3 ubiquitin-protein ligase UPL3 [Psilocybe cubensis]|uniref:HECT-type E3 ubiquitin transferase n=2 Tax=Psilocybe cubensis TaxID=181762 RepID=A0A8H7XVX7_PSICU|nr:E3 ubiquitin-protein ligase UPL3 [Psilocybe cubensis]KAH9479473.1 E3 ubiquitin-protein ligase UPL3 [Psilocybe cubensis]
MDLRPIQHQEATSSSSASTTHPSHNQDSFSNTNSESKPVRSSARVKAAKNKAQISAQTKEFTSISEQGPRASSSIPSETISTRNTRASPAKPNRSRESNSSKGKGKEVSQESSSRSTKRHRRNPTSTTAPLTINEPIRDTKGKKRAAPETDDEDLTAPSTKRIRTSGYSLRSNTSSANPADMPRKARTSTSKGKAALKSKMAVASSSRLETEDVEMLDPDYTNSKHGDSSDLDESMEEKHDIEGQHAEGDQDVGIEEAKDDDEDEDEDEDEDGEGGHDDEARVSSSDAGPIPGGMDEATALAIFGDYRQFGSYMMSLSSRLKTMLNNIKPTADPTTRLVTLQELSELLSISTEDTLAGSFQVEQFVRELVKILGGRGADEDEEEDEDPPERDEDAALAAALAMSSGGTYQGDDNLEAQLLACRCLANLMEALPGVAHTVVYHGAIPVLCSKLIEIDYIDLAEQTLSTLEKISEEFPSSIVREGGLAALLTYVDFFPIASQRTALQAASNCCRNVSSEHFPMIRGVWPNIRNCLAYSDQRLVEYACLCVIRIVDSYHRSSVENLESLIDSELIRAVNQLLLPAGGSPLIASNTYTLLLRALATSAKASAKITVALLEADIVDTLYQILTGVLPSASLNHLDQGGAAGGQGLGGGLADMTVMENLAHRPKEQVEEALSLISELLPPLPKDGVFDHKAYTEKSLAKLVKAKAKAERAAARLVTQAQTPTGAPATLSSTPGSAVPTDDASPVPGSSEVPVQEPEENRETSAALPGIDVAPDRTDMLRSKPAVVGRFMQLLVPILVDVYAASVITPVRIKTLTGLLKAVSFLDADGLKPFVPVASFASSILSSKDHPSLVIGALQLVDLLLGKLPSLYKPTFHREGVFHEIETLAERTLTTSKAKAKDAPESGDDAASSSNAPPASIPGFKKLSSTSLDPEDAITLRARVIQFKYLADKQDIDEDGAFQSLRNVVVRLSAPNSSDQEYSEALWELADLFASPHTSVSSFELLQSGVVDGLLLFATDENRSVSLQRRREILLDAFSSRKVKNLTANQTPFATLVKKLQESFTRMESFEVITVAQNSDDSKRSSPSLLARQLRLRLVAGDESDIPKSLHNIVVSIHAIATFQALHDYLRPRVAGHPTGVSAMLSALAASGYTGIPKLPGDDKPVLSAAAESSSATVPSTSGVQRRRSQRLAKQGTNSAPSDNAISGPEEGVAATTENAVSTLSEIKSPVTDPTSSSLPVDPAPSETVVESEQLHAEFTDDEDEIDADVFEDEVDSENPMSEKTITLSVVEEGGKVEAQTPEGTRVATPNAAKESLSGMTRNSISTRGSYAAALKAKPTDWHLEFSMDDHILPLDLTIYGAIHQHEMRKKTGATPLNMIWQGVYTIKFKKVSGPAPTPEARAENPDFANKNRSSSSPSLSSLPEDAPHTKILRLLRMLCHLNTIEAERATFPADKRNLPDSSFVNNKLTAKLTRQLEEPMIVASSCLPDWALDLPQHFPFLFPFATRYNFLQSTSFGYARLILKWQSQQNRGQDSSRRDDGIGFLGRLQRQKVRISRKHILESAVKVFELYGSSSSILEVEYFEEVGTGLGPTLEFYSLVSKEFARKDLKLWRDADSFGSGVYVVHPNGLYPAPLSREDILNDGGQKRTHILRVIGQFVAKAMLDSRIIDLSFNKVFLKLVLGEEVPLTIATLKLVDPDLANSLAKVQSLAAESNAMKGKLAQKVAQIEQVTVEDLALDFTMPGYDIELRPGGRNILVTSENVSEYVAEVLDAILGKGAAIQAKAFRDGFSKVFPITDLRAFSADELVMLFGNSEEDWSVETLSEALKADHGFNVDSRAIRDLVEIMSEYDPSTRRAYLQFITGSPKLPIGGFRGLNPPLTVVRKPHEAPLTADDYLPSVMTCVNYLKLPEYSTKSVMKEKLKTAMLEGVGSFHLS